MLNINFSRNIFGAALALPLLISNANASNEIDDIASSATTLSTALTDIRHCILDYVTSYSDLMNVSQTCRTLREDVKARLANKFDGSVILFGNTGAGASTIAHLMMGGELKARLTPSGDYIGFDAVQHIDKVNFGHNSAWSKTKAITPLLDFAHRRIIWDCPGYYSTHHRSAEDKSNAVGEMLRLTNTKARVIILAEWALFSACRPDSFIEFINTAALALGADWGITTHYSLIVTKTPRERQMDIAVTLSKYLNGPTNIPFTKEARALLEHLIKTPEAIAQFNEPNPANDGVPLIEESLRTILDKNTNVFNILNQVVGGEQDMILPLLAKYDLPEEKK